MVLLSENVILYHLRIPLVAIAQVGTDILAVFDLLRSWRHNHVAVLCAFDLIELDGKNLRRTPIEERKYALANLLYRDQDGIAFNKHYDCDGAVVYKHVCALGCEGIVSKRLGSPYRSGRTDHWVKVKNRRRRRSRARPRRTGADNSWLPRSCCAGRPTPLHAARDHPTSA